MSSVAEILEDKVVRRMITIVVTYAEFKLMLEGRIKWKFPQGTTIVGVRESMQHGGLILLLRNDAFAPIELYQQVPMAMETQRWEDEEGYLLISVKP